MAKAKHNDMPAENNGLSRRNLLTAAPLVALSAALAAGDVNAAVVEALTAGQAETPVMRALREWDALYLYLNSDAARELSEDDFDAECDRRRAMELRLAGIPSVGISDFAAKVLALTNHGDHDLDAENSAPAFWAEARALVGA